MALVSQNLCSEVDATAVDSDYADSGTKVRKCVCKGEKCNDPAKMKDYKCYYSGTEDEKDEEKTCPWVGNDFMHCIKQSGSEYINFANIIGCHDIFIYNLTRRTQ